MTRLIGEKKGKEMGEDLANENKRLREALREYALRENWEYGKRPEMNVWNRNYEHGFKLAEETLGEGRQWPREEKKS